MPDVGRLVHGLRHGTDDERLDERTLRGVTQPSRNGLKVPRRDRLRQPRIDVERRKSTRQSVEFLGLRLAMHPIQSRSTRLLELLRDCDIREDHAFLDQAVGIITGAQLYSTDTLRGVDHELRLGRIEVESAALATGFVQGPIDVHQYEQRLQQLSQLRTRSG